MMMLMIMMMHTGSETCCTLFSSITGSLADSLFDALKGDQVRTGSEQAVPVKRYRVTKNMNKIKRSAA